MSNIVCYSSDGSVLEYFNQWSTNQKLIIRGADLSAAPVFYFYNAKIKEALAVESEIVNNDIVVNIPDIMLQYEFPIILDADYSFSTSADFTIRIPIMPKAKPGDYIFDGTGGSGGSQKPSIEIVNNLTTDSPIAALSAAQGVVLKSMIDDVGLNIDVEDRINAALEAAKNRGDFDGTGIVSVLRTGGSGQPGTTDTYTITLSDGSTSFFTVYNGRDGVNIEVDGDNNVSLDVFIELQNRINSIQAQIGTETVADQIQTSIGNSGHITESYVDEKIALLIDSAPETLNTLNELSEALGDDPNFATSIINQLGSKVDKADGMGLSSNDYTDDDKNLLLSINERVGSDSVINQINTAWNERKDKINADTVDGMHAADFASASSVSDLSSKIGNDSVQDQINNAVSNLRLGDVSIENVVPIKKGGTGATSIQSARNNLGLGGVSVENVVPVKKGGTGANSADAARSNLGLGSVATEDITPVTKGGTGANNVVTARSNLGAAPMYEYGTTDLTAGSSPLETGKLYFVYE